MPKRDTKGRFKKGASGNPKGKPKNVLNKNTKARNDFLGKISTKFYEELEEMLNDQENPDNRREAVKILADRLLPKLRPIDLPISIQLPEMESTEDALKTIAVISKLVSEGKVTPSEGQEIAKIIEIYRRLVETEDLEKRIEMLENRK